MDALRFMHAKKHRAFRAGPLECLLRNEPIDAHSLDPLQIGDDAHGVSGPIAGVQTPQMRAGDLGAGKAEPVFPRGQFPAVLDRTANARVRFVAIVPTATGAWLTNSNESAAQPAIHATRCDEHRVIGMSSKIHVGHGAAQD